MSTLYIRHYSRASIANAELGAAPACPFALVSHAGTIEREGVAMLSQLSSMVSMAKRVVLLLAASDVTMLRVKVPPLSAARLKAAWPNLVEEQLIGDPAECVIVAVDVAANVKDGLRSVAVVQRSWLMLLIKNFSELGARNLAALPAQLCLPYQKGCVSAVLAEQGDGMDLTLRWSDHEGMGVPILREHDTANPEQQVVQALRAVMPARPMHLYVAQAQVLAYQKVIDAEMTVTADSWPRWISCAKAALLNTNLMAGLNIKSRFDRQRWRWPLILMTLFVTVNVAGLNIDSWRMGREAALLRSVMFQTFKSTYPREKVIIDPLAQMQQKILAARQDAGQVDVNDFIMLTARFGQAWRSVMQSHPGSADIAGLEYRDRSLLVKLKNNGAIPVPVPMATIAAMKLALAEQKLSLSQPAAGGWEVRSGL